MSVLNQFHTAEERVAERLRELKPMVDEYRELEQVAQRIGLSLNEDATTIDEQRPAFPARTRQRRRGTKTKARSATATRQESGAAATAKRSATTAAARRTRASRRSGDGGGPGSSRTSRRQQDVLRLVNQHPGITVRQVAKELGVDPTGLYRPVHKLEQEGVISKQGAALQPRRR